MPDSLRLRYSGGVMFDRFTDRARHVVATAQEEARRLGHNAIGPEHLLLGLAADGESIAGKALAELGVSLDAARGQVEAIDGRGPQATSGHIPFTPPAKKVLELTLREALALGHNYIAAQHIMLGLIRQGEGTAVQVLTRCGVSLVAARQKVIDLMKAALPPPQPPGLPPFPPRALVYEVALWEIYKLSGADTDGDDGPGALVAGMGCEGFAKAVVDAVRELRAECDSGAQG